jgi:hypothetical protein
MYTHIRRWGVVVALAVGLNAGMAPTSIALGSGPPGDSPPLSVPQSEPCRENCGGRPPRKRCSASQVDGLVQPTKQCGW